VNGKKTTEILAFAGPNGNEILFPVATITGKGDGPHFVITAGIHGAEYPAIVAAITLFNELKTENVLGKITIVTIASVNAFEARTPFVNPLDKKNPNRVFPGNPRGSYTDVLVHYLFNKIIAEGDYYLDLHGGDLVEALEPFSLHHVGVNELVDSKSRELAQYYALPNNIATTTNSSWSDDGTSYANAAKLGIPSAIVEAGGIGQLDQDSVDLHLRGLKNVLRHFGCLKGEAFEPIGQHYYRDFIWLRSPVKGIFYCAVKLGDSLRTGQPVGTVVDYFGNLLVNIKAPVAGKLLFLTTSPAIAVEGLILGIGIK